jgi:mono/diheme cytochrome c family protein
VSGMPGRLLLHAPAVLLAVLGLGGSGCRDQQPRFREPLKLGGQVVPADLLNQGHEVYFQFCYACHGEKGDGNGPAAPGMRPPPRDFTAGKFKFPGVAAGELPGDEDLLALLRNGLAGTSMLPWDLSEPARVAVVAYIKTFSPRWQNETPGEPVRPDVPDPWQGREDEAFKLGEKIYHLSGVEMDPATQQPKTVLAGCIACHPSYLPGPDLAALSQAVLGKPPQERERQSRPILKESDYRAGDTKLSILPTDFLFHRLKTGTSTLAIFRTVAAGIDGAAMPTWKGAIKDPDLWALAHYLRRLASMRDTPAGAALRARLDAAPGR